MNLTQMKRVEVYHDTKCVVLRDENSENSVLM
jgi:hypothetical protein